MNVLLAWDIFTSALLTSLYVPFRPPPSRHAPRGLQHIIDKEKKKKRAGEKQQQGGIRGSDPGDSTDVT